MTSGAITTSDCLAELGRKYVGWCDCGQLIEKLPHCLPVRQICSRCGVDPLPAGILELGDPRVLAILDTFQGVRIRLERRQSTVAALEGNFARTGGRSLIR